MRTVFFLSDSTYRSMIIFVVIRCRFAYGTASQYRDGIRIKLFPKQSLDLQRRNDIKILSGRRYRVGVYVFTETS